MSYGSTKLINFSAARLAALHNTAARIRGSNPVQWVSTVFDGITTATTATPAGATITTPTFPATNTPVTNNTGYDVLVNIIGGTYTQVKLNGTNQGVASSVVVPAGETIAVVFSVAPTWNWYPLGTAPAGYVQATVAGAQQKIAYYNQ